MEKRDVRRVTEARVLAALAHPLRRRIMDALTVDGPSTASMLAERTDQAVANISHHLKVLASCDLIVEAPELARDRRERWWRRDSSGLSWSTNDFDNDPSSQAVASAAVSLNLDRHASLARAWHAASEQRRAAWGEGPFTVDRWLKLTPEELAELDQQIVGLLDQWANREVPDDGRERESVFVFAYGMPAQP